MELWSCAPLLSLCMPMAFLRTRFACPDLALHNFYTQAFSTLTQLSDIQNIIIQILCHMVKDLTCLHHAPTFPNQGHDLCQRTNIFQPGTCSVPTRNGASRDGPDDLRVCRPPSRDVPPDTNVWPTWCINRELSTSRPTK